MPSYNLPHYYLVADNKCMNLKDHQLFYHISVYVNQQKYIKGKSCLPLEFTGVSWLTLPTILASNLHVENNGILHSCQLNPRETKSGRGCQKDATWCILLHFGYRICSVKSLNIGTIGREYTSLWPPWLIEKSVLQNSQNANLFPFRECLMKWNSSVHAVLNTLS